jgi:predicted DNA-binding protein YlxM (UPF0122 family)
VVIDIERLIGLYRARTPMKHIVELLNISRTSIHRTLRQHIQMRSSAESLLRLSPKEISRAVELYNSGISRH